MPDINQKQELRPTLDKPVKSDAAKIQIMRQLGKEGYKTYAELLGYFDVYLMDGEGIAGVKVDKAEIYFNQNLSLEQISMIARHEILHEFLTHFMRQKAFHSKRNDDIEKLPIAKRNILHQLQNIAGDLEISNIGYTEADKKTAKALRLGDKRVVKGLVTEIDYPGWENMTFEEMYEKLIDEMEKDEEKIQQLLDKFKDILKDLADELGDNDSNGDQPPAGGSTQSNGNHVPSNNEVNAAPEDTPLDPNGEPAAKIVADAEEKLKDELRDRQEPLLSDADQETVKDLADRVKKLKDMLKDPKRFSKAKAEVEAARNKEKIANEIKHIERERKNPLSQFKANLDRFIAKQLEMIEEESYVKLNPAYEGTEFLMPGIRRWENTYIPRVNVYWDVSGSFSDEAKTEGARKAIALLNKYVREGRLTMKAYYFADKVADTAAAAGGGTYGTPILEHVQATKPDNVVVITDGDISDCTYDVQVPGAVWYLFYDSESDNIQEHLTGKKQTKAYLIEY